MTLDKVVTHFLLKWLLLKALNLHTIIPGLLISPQPDQEGNKLMFLSEWREFPSAPCLAGKKNDSFKRTDCSA